MWGFSISVSCFSGCWCWTISDLLYDCESPELLLCTFWVKRHDHPAFFSEADISSIIFKWRWKSCNVLMRWTCRQKLVQPVYPEFARIQLILFPSAPLMTSPGLPLLLWKLVLIVLNFKIWMLSFILASLQCAFILLGKANLPC